ncbi:MAG TPA: rRNA pseudouridine synthase [Lutibacter sp.]|nr:rRNA pseudouridine synthase [Lutibacter sp.]
MSKQNSSRGRQDKSSPKKTQQKSQPKTSTEGIRLNKYIAHAGICSRREADVYIKSGSVTVNGKTITEMGYKVQPDSEVRFDTRLINPEVHRYVLLNKPKNYITTVEDDRGRRTVMDLIQKAAKERLYPVGRLDRNTTGLLLFSNDGEMTKKLTHPKHKVHKLYHVTLDKKVSLNHLREIADTSFKIEDKRVFVDAISYIGNKPKSEIGIEIHSGRNRIIRKIFESLGYTVIKLDRTIFAGLTKKNLPRGFWRHLTQQEVNNLKMIK